MQDDTIRRSMQILNDTRKDIADRLISFGEDNFDVSNLQRLQGVVDNALLQFESRFDSDLKQSASSFWDQGFKTTTEPLENVVGINIQSLGPTQGLLEIIQTANSDLVKDVTRRARNQINNELRQAVFGLKRPMDAQRDIVKALSAQKQQGTRKNLAAAAERIVRTQMNQIFSIAQEQGFVQAKKQIPDLQRQWITARDNRVRGPGSNPASKGNHRRLDGEIRDVGERFSNGLLFPRDPAGKAEDVVNCR